jgi:hypothetical protein
MLWTDGFDPTRAKDVPAVVATIPCRTGYIAKRALLRIFMPHF